jgi:hypothetical protein
VNPTPVVTVTALGDVTEGSGNITFRFTRTEETGPSPVVNFTLGGSASYPSDYSISFATVTFAPGSATADRTLTVEDDLIAEFSETVVMSVAVWSGYGPEYSIGTPSSATAIIHDNETPVVQVEKLLDTVEGSTTIFRLSRMGDKSGSITVNYSIGGTATSGSDFTAVSGTVVFAADAGTADVEIATLHDTSYDPDETVQLTVTSGTGYTVDSQNDQATIGIDDDAGMVFEVESNQGVIWYDVPYEDVDPALATQSLPVDNFKLTLAGETFTDADTANPPTAEFEYGLFVGLTFAINTSGIAGFPYTSLAVSGLDFTAQPLVGQPISVLQKPERTSISVDFSNAGTTTAYDLTIWVYIDNLNRIDVTFKVAANTTGGGLRDAVFAILKDKGVDVTAVPGDRLVITGTKDNQFKGIRFNTTGMQSVENLTKAGRVQVDDIDPFLNVNEVSK